MRFNLYRIVMDSVVSYLSKSDRSTVYTVLSATRNGEAKIIRVDVTEMEVLAIGRRAIMLGMDELWNKWLDDFCEPNNWTAAGRLVRLTEASHLPNQNQT